MGSRDQLEVRDPNRLREDGNEQPGAPSRDDKDETKSWKMAKRIREYVQAVIEDRKQKGQEPGPDTPLGNWVEWALQQADRFDPLAKSPPSILDREKELEEAPEGWRIR